MLCARKCASSPFQDRKDASRPIHFFVSSGKVTRPCAFSYASEIVMGWTKHISGKKKDKSAVLIGCQTSRIGQSSQSLKSRIIRRFYTSSHQLRGSGGKSIIVVRCVGDRCTYYFTVFSHVERWPLPIGWRFLQANRGQAIRKTGKRPYCSRLFEFF